MAVTRQAEMQARLLGYRLKIGLLIIVIMVLGFFNESHGPLNLHLGRKSQALLNLLSLQRNGPDTRTVNPLNTKKYRLSRSAHYGEDSVGSFPYFEYNVPRNVTTVVGQTAFLHCRVEQLGDKAVSWIRKRDLHILTAGILTYTSDQRFQVIRPDKSENWTLQIKFPQERDAGIYECQVNTEPKMSLAFQLNVVEAKAKVLGPADLYVKTGSLLSLTCVLSQGPHDLGTIFWYKGSKLIEYKEAEANEVEEQRIRLKTEWTEQLSSRLTIEKLQPTDSGNYSCVPTMAETASVNVHVINGEHPAAMQHGNANTASPCALSVNLFISLYCTLATLYTSTVDGFR